MLSTNLKGEIASLKVQTEAAKFGYVVSIPTTDVRYDLIIDDGKTLSKVQVKYANGKDKRSSGSVILNLVSDHGNGKVLKYQENEIDFILAYIPATDQVVKVTKDMFIGRTALTFRIDPPKRNTSDSTYVKDIIWSE